jgi:hypothetical protein
MKLGVCGYVDDIGELPACDVPFQKFRCTGSSRFPCFEPSPKGVPFFEHVVSTRIQQDEIIPIFRKNIDTTWIVRLCPETLVVETTHLEDDLSRVVDSMFNIG